jgi:L-aspartate oxidase
MPERQIDRAAMLLHLPGNAARDPIPVGPAAHYIMGGVDTDECGRTSRMGLYAAGEVACTGVHGANRLASNSLLEGLVFGARAAEAMLESARVAARKPDRVAADGRAIAAEAGDRHTLAMNEVQDLMWRKAGLFRTEEGLTEAVARLDAAYAAAIEPEAGHGPQTSSDWRNLHLVIVARLIARAALRRRESRGGHFRADYAHRDDQHWRVHLTEEVK